MEYEYFITHSTNGLLNINDDIKAEFLRVINSYCEKLNKIN